ncbi:MAG: hypothetical protein GOMPHAMPRED_006352 [Gomphillus americanus]|uniref:Uncharacterized protein n=1 Tax=Gomphillus americanus TaxID=1940652 RepID=A0A8H3EPC5_9LECA|nr:MAG: hypothetical protein GOMPHAMPRED_006352 [Gomphillus americanus]
MSLPWLAKLGKLHYSSKDKNAERHNKQCLASIEIDEMSEAGTDTVIINKPKRALFGPTGAVHAESPLATYSSTRQYAKRYFSSNPGKDYLASNIAEHGKLYKLVSNPDSTPEEILACRYILEYRLNKIAIAEQLLLTVGMPRPRQSRKDVYPRYFSVDLLEAYVYIDEARIRKWENIFTMVTSSKLFGRPLQEQGRIWDKPERYIAAAFFFMPGCNSDLVRDMLAAMISVAASENDPAFVRVMRPEESCIAVRARSLSPHTSKALMARNSKSSNTSTVQKSKSRGSQEGFQQVDVEWPVLSKETPHPQ